MRSRNFSLALFLHSTRRQMLFPNKPETEQGFPGGAREALLCLWLILRILYLFALPQPPSSLEELYGLRQEAAGQYGWREQL